MPLGTSEAAGWGDTQDGLFVFDSPLDDALFALHQEILILVLENLTFQPFEIFAGEQELCRTQE